ncbi:potassium channel family protein [bacterium]
MGKKFYIALLLLLTTFLIGIIGYKTIIGSHVTIVDCVYMTLITLSTVGFGEIVDLTNYPLARIFTMFLILIGMGNLLFLISSFTSFLVEGKLKRIFWRRKVMKIINSYNNHFIICGAGNTGIHIIDELFKTKKEFVVIEQNQKVIEELREKYSNTAVIEGDATSDTVLLSAGIKKAKGLVCVLPHDKDNLFLIVTAKQLNPIIRIISKINNLEHDEKLIRAGASSTVPPDYIGALRMASELIRPNVVGFLDAMLRDKSNLRVEELSVPEHSWVIGKTLKELNIRQKVGLQLIAIQDNNTCEYNYHPNGDTVIQKDSTLLTIGEPVKFEKFISFISSK